jgi:YggT family protein
MIILTFDLNILIAMIVDSLLGWLAIAVINYLQGQEPYRR